MPRLARSSLGTSFFHIVVQGINREYIFDNNVYMEKYLELIAKYREKYPEVKLLSYCIMNNHAHMLIYCEDIVMLGQFMKCINTSYARFYNKNQRRVGYVFRDRYLGQPIYKEKYLYECMSYIHKNPVKAKIVEKENDYKYSSYNDYINKNGIVTEEVLKVVFGMTKDYIKDFLVLTESEYEFIDFVEEKQLPEEAINEYCENKKIDLEHILDDATELVNLLRYLLMECKFSKNRISEILNISSFKITRLLQ